MDIFTPAEQAILVKYRKENFAEKTLHYTDRRLIGKCPLTPEEVGTFNTVYVEAYPCISSHEFCMHSSFTLSGESMSLLNCHSLESHGHSAGGVDFEVSRLRQFYAHLSCRR